MKRVASGDIDYQTDVYPVDRYQPESENPIEVFITNCEKRNVQSLRNYIE